MKFMKLISFLVATASLVAADSRSVKVEGGSVPAVETEDKFWGGGCRGELNLPFMATNVELTASGDEHYFGFHSRDTESETKFLKDVRYCPDAGSFGAYRIYGEVVPLEEFKAAVEEEVRTNGNIDHVFYEIHGVGIDPETTFLDSYRFNEMHGENTGYLMIPMSWRSHWGVALTLYDIDRNGPAIEAGKTFAASMDVFKSSVPTSIMVHSMGNWVARVMAQNTVDPEIVFENMFMVGADARMDLFSTDFNPAAPQAINVKGNTVKDDVYLDIPEDELRENGGYAITQIANHVHVIWNSADAALDIRELFQVGYGENVRRALGKVGDESETLTELPYFQERVTYHDFSNMGIPFPGHEYQFDQIAVDVYAEFKSDKNTVATTSRFNTLRANANVD
eukprot:CAMPEP_0196141514 /NCGR_PEP_ID=MMETSP0910-20130528/9931_1 /TAXON_ID=49265 /ORGANISM="Thalassiosira rotula, Strain GSO102" /LENGTH=394 /DNA_ID=CAMNT_0041402677 /DNA_START=94 /DNA_END=1278 /DNA_ORIENTATION=+